MAATRIKVPTTKLLERVKAARKRAEADHAKKVADFTRKQARYTLDVKKWAASVRDKLREEVKKTDEEFVEAHGGRDYGRSASHSVCVEYPPEKPTDPREFDPRNFDQDIALLDMTEEPVIQVSTEDRWARYL